MEPAARIAVPRKCLETGAVYLARRIQGIGTVALPRSLVLLGRSNSPGEASLLCTFPAGLQRCQFGRLAVTRPPRATPRGVRAVRRGKRTRAFLIPVHAPRRRKMMFAVVLASLMPMIVS